MSKVHLAEFGHGVDRFSLYLMCQSPVAVPEDHFNEVTRCWVLPNNDEFSLDAEDVNCLQCVLRRYPKWIVWVTALLVSVDARIRSWFAV